MKYAFQKIDRALIDIAKIEANKRMKFGFREDNQGLNYKYNMILISCIGELVFQQFLLEKKIDFSFTDLDFKGRVISVNNKHIESSTSGYGTDFSRLNLLYNDKQYEETSGIDAVVQIFINGYNYKSYEFNDDLCNTGVIVGYIDFSDIKKYPVNPNRRRPNHVVSLDNLKPVTDLL